MPREVLRGQRNIHSPVCGHDATVREQPVNTNNRHPVTMGVSVKPTVISPDDIAIPWLVVQECQEAQGMWIISFFFL